MGKNLQYRYAFFEKDIVVGVSTYILKSKYFKLTVEVFLQSVFYSNSDIKDHLIRAKLIL